MTGNNRCKVFSYTTIIEPHIHLDTTLTAGEPKWNESGTLFEGIGVGQKKRILNNKKCKN